MHVTHLSLADFRNYESAELELDTGVTVIVGPNGQGKTNLIEALGYVSTLGSHRVPHDAPLVRRGASRAVIRTALSRADREARIELEIVPGSANRAKINRGQFTKTRDVLGWLKTVLFAPEDLALVKGDPDTRRKFLDDVLVQRMPRMASIRMAYDKSLKQRNALLKSSGSEGRGRRDSQQDSYLESTLSIWDEQLARSGAEILCARADLIRELGPPMAEAYGFLSGGSGATVSYRSSVDLASDDGGRLPAEQGDTRTKDEWESAFRAALTQQRSREIQRGLTLVGPHRDDVLIGLNDFPAKGYASHGESWSLALAMRLGCFDLFKNSQDLVGDSEPVLILDDVFAELDSTRRERLSRLVEPAQQVLITAAVLEDVPPQLQQRKVRIDAGHVVSEHGPDN